MKLISAALLILLAQRLFAAPETYPGLATVLDCSYCPNAVSIKEFMKDKGRKGSRPMGLDFGFGKRLADPKPRIVKEQTEAGSRDDSHFWDSRTSATYASVLWMSSKPSVDIHLERSGSRQPEELASLNRWTRSTLAFWSTRNGQAFGFFDIHGGREQNFFWGDPIKSPGQWKDQGFPWEKALKKVLPQKMKIDDPQVVSFMGVPEGWLGHIHVTDATNEYYDEYYPRYYVFFIFNEQGFKVVCPEAFHKNGAKL